MYDFNACVVTLEELYCSILAILISRFCFDLFLLAREGFVTVSWCNIDIRFDCPD